MSDPTSLVPGQVIGGCRVVRELKRGGMGCVYLGEHLTLRCPVAIKTILPFHDDQRARRLFFREAQLCAQVDHPNVAVMHNAGEEGGVAYLVMRFVEGKNLSEYLQEQGGPLPWPTVLRVMRLAVRGLAAVHRKGLIHRDIKPSNIMVSAEGRVLVVDFGLVREAAEATYMSTGRIAGTPQFMSPEQCRGAALDRRTDLFSVGASLYFLLTATPPFGRGEGAMVVARILMKAAPPPVHEVNPAVPREVSDLVARAMAFDPDARYQTAEDLYRAITDVVGRLAPAAGRAPASPIPSGDGSLSSPLPTPPPTPPPSATATASGTLSDLAPLELVSDGPADLTPDATRRTWLILGGAAALALLTLAVVSSHAVPPPEPPPSLHGMIEIPAGNARLGVSRQRVDAYVQALGDKYDPIRIAFKDIDEREVSVPVPRFWIDRHEVTNAAYLAFVRATGHAPPPKWAGGHPGLEALQHPVTGVTRADADAYARWAKKRLPTVAQWMRAYHGAADTLFLWGDEFDPGRANVAENAGLKPVEPVGATPGDVTPLGVADLVGNVSEITRDVEGAGADAASIVKGGNGVNPGRIWGLGPVRDRLKHGERRDDVGFRCVYEPPP